MLVSADVRPADGYVWHAAPDTYLRAMTHIGAIPMVLPSMPGRIDLEAALKRVDGVLLTGSRSNVHPSLYGVESSERHEPFDRERDAVTLPLIRLAIRKGIPLLAICRGFQELNVALGGSLVTEAQERPGSLDHRSPVSEDRDVRFGLAHEVDFEADGLFAGMVRTCRARVNSLHRQAVDRLASGLTVEARAPDGTVEAVRVTDAPAFAAGVQWHPEYWAESDATSEAILRAFAGAMRRRMEAR
ncbi:putative glutamine amidotransferase [Faunimonas pinastri]|uniref:gamma-glutamyl-gamma-aminobutyrate hydrolase n=1 Tax=Faunimonas pinastri TaxID=1855383 RepID=A0A1H9P1Z2_9HYPH|nr:putative glutamine amidotransferase [Faunimonas pinastri]